jgi:hypothetical protein
MPLVTALPGRDDHGQTFQQA